MADRVIKAALLGLGTVGGGVYKVLKMQEEEMIPKLGAKVELKKILVRNIEKHPKRLTIRPCLPITGKRSWRIRRSRSLLS